MTFPSSWSQNRTSDIRGHGGICLQGPFNVPLAIKSVVCSSSAECVTLSVIPPTAVKPLVPGAVLGCPWLRYDGLELVSRALHNKWLRHGCAMMAWNYYRELFTTNGILNPVIKVLLDCTEENIRAELSMKQLFNTLDKEIYLII